MKSWKPEVDDDVDMRLKLLHIHICRRISCLANSQVSPISISSSIRTLVQHGEYWQALQLYARYGFYPSRTTIFAFPSLLKACALLPNLDHGKTIHSAMIVLGLQHDPYIATSLVNFYVKCGKLDCAVDVFDKLSESEVPADDVTIWNSMIDGFFRFGHFKDGVDLFRRMLTLGVRPDAYSLCIVVGVLSKYGNLGRKEGKHIHGYMLRNLFSGDSFLETALVEMYLKFGLLTDAWHLFVELEDKENIVLWNVMIRGFSGNGFWEFSLELYSIAKSKSVKPASTSVTGALGACCRGENFGFGRQVHCDVVKMGFEHDPYVCTSLLTMYAKCGMVEEAKDIIYSVADKGLEIWNAMVAAYAGNNCWYNALELFNQMRQIEILPDSFTLSNVIVSCSMLGLYDYGKSVHAQLVKRPIKSNPTIESALLTMYSKCGCDADACIVFNSMEEKDVVAWGSMISGFCQNRKYREALKIFSSMKDDERLKPDSDIMASVVTACTGLEALDLGLQFHSYMAKSGFELDVFAGSSLVDMYSKCGLLEMAEKVFSSMPLKNLVAWNSMISCYSRNNLPCLSIRLFHQMMDHGFFPDSVSVTSALVAISSMTSLAKGKSIHGYMIRLSMPLDAHTQNALIDMYLKCGFLMYAQNIFQKTLNKSLITWNLMISGYGSHGDCLGALSLFDEMKRAGESPDDSTFLSLISACNHSGFVHEGKRLFYIMRQDYGIEPKMDHYANIVDLLGRAGHLEEAYAFIKAMPVEADRGIWLCLLSASRAHHNMELGEMAAQNLLRMEPSRGSNYLQLINLYAGAGLRDKAAEVRAEMKEKGLQKSPGCSWIELRNRIHVFYSGDSSSAEAAEIFNILNSLKSNMRISSRSGREYIPGI